VAPEDRRTALAALSGLLEEFRRGRIVDVGFEREGIDRHTGALSEAWDRRFPGFPAQHFPFTSFRGEYFRGRRDEHLKDIIVQLLAGRDRSGATVVNPACVFGRHGRDLASRLATLEVVCTDIDPNWFRLYRWFRLGRLPANFRFVKDDVFEPKMQAIPTAVVFFGACGSVSDGAIDFAIRSSSPYLMCRTCCHDNIGGNTEIVNRANQVNRFFRFKNWAYRRMREKARFAGFYFSDRYTRDAYPRSEAARKVSTPDEFLAVARNTPDSDVCRAIIDLDRYLHLMESGYDVWYRGELFVAEMTQPSPPGSPTGG